MDITLKPRKNKHLNAKECYMIEALLKGKFKESAIANAPYTAKLSEGQ